jgi:hypothetical protein
MGGRGASSILRAGVIAGVVSCGSAWAQAPTLTGKVDCAWGSADCNRCVVDVVDSFARLRSHGDILGFHMNGAEDVQVDHHWQGIQRLTSTGARHFAISRSVSDDDETTEFVTVEMGSRNAEGLRFRSNRLDPDRDNFATPPPLEDGIVLEHPRDQDFKHAGGIQLLGNILAVPVERGATIDPGPPPTVTDPGASKVFFYDMSDPVAPDPIHQLDHSNLSNQAGAAFLSRLADNRILLGVGRADSNVLDFYVSTGSDIRAPGFDFVHFDTWDEDELIGLDSEFGNYQSINLVTQCDGSLFLVGTHENTLTQTGEDFADAFLLTNGPGSDAVIEKKAIQHLVCGNRGVNHCNLDAAGGVYVDPAGQMYIYGTEHDNDGPLDGVYPCSGSLCSVKLEEFRPIPHAECSRIGNAWVELYDDHGFGDRSLMIDFVDRNLEDYTNYDRAEGFEDKASSARWCLPPGVTYRLWEDKEDCGGDPLDLVGTGVLEEIANFDNVGFGDKASCSEWLGGPFADAGPDRIAECTRPLTAVTLDGTASSDVQDDPLTFNWSAPGVVFNDPHSPQPTGSFPRATTTVTLTVSDGVNQGTDSALVSVVDTTTPTILCPQSVEVECRSTGGTSASDPAIQSFLDGASAQDTCDPTVSITTSAPSFFPLGPTAVTFTASDDDTNQSQCASTVSVVDTVGPEIDPGFNVSPAALHPPNHKLVSVTVSNLVAQDACSSSVQIYCSVASSEPVNAAGDGNTAFDIVFAGEPIFNQSTGPRPVAMTGNQGSLPLQLRSERSGNGVGRVYTITCHAVDGNGLAGPSRSVQVSVPRGR